MVKKEKGTFLLLEGETGKGAGWGTEGKKNDRIFNKSNSASKRLLYLTISEPSEQPTRK